MNKTIQLLFLTITLFMLNSPATAMKLTPCDTDQCVDYFNKFKAGAKRGHISALTTMGEFYYHGFGTNIDKDKGFLNLRKAARHGNVRALYKTGLIYLSDKKYKNVKKGMINLEKSARKDFLNSTFLLGIVYLNKSFGLYNQEKADKYLAKSYQDRHPDLPKVIDIIEEKEEITSDNFPLLLQAMAKKPVIINAKQERVWPKSNIEVIAIESPSIQAILNQQIIAIRRPIISLGSRIPSYSCKSCYSTWGVDGLKDFTFL
jgi:hypothetical protein